MYVCVCVCVSVESLSKTERSENHMVAISCTISGIVRKLSSTLRLSGSATITAYHWFPRSRISGIDGFRATPIEHDFVRECSQRALIE